MENNNKQLKMLYRSRTNRILFGVCGGLGEYFDMDPLIFRIIFIALCLGAGSGLLIYLILAFLIPKNPMVDTVVDKPKGIDIKERAQELAEELKDLKGFKNKKRHGAFRIIFGLIVLVFGFELLAQNLHLIPGFSFDFSFIWNLWPILVILLGISIISKNRS